MEGRAELLDRPTCDVLPAAHMAKYADQLAAIGVSAAEYAATYSQAIRIVPADYLPWHGRTTPQSARLAGAPTVSIDEPRRDRADEHGEFVSRRRPRSIIEPRHGPSLREWLGEPLARGLRGMRPVASLA
jgi:hypothetical protein